MTIDINALKEHFSNKAIPTDTDFSNLIDLAETGQNAVTDNHNNTITANNLTYDLSKTGITPISLYNSGSFNDLPLGTVFAGTEMTDGPDKVHTFTTTTVYFSYWDGRKAQIAIADNENLMYFRVYMGTQWINWTLLSDDSKVVHNSGNEEIGGQKTFDTAPIDKTTGNPYITKSDVPKVDLSSYATNSQLDAKADDSKVAHLSGANNFDTVPTYGTGNKPFAINDTGATTARPTGQAAGYQYFDTNLNKPVWYTGKNWVDSTGATA
ncbi:hypothetical protein [Lactiplantibacillus plantarum]|uniref:hypothetical protein n=1 Tax=Lactiplantibacillus plantarum TaxID=1590 RepID=UPI003B5065A9